MSKSLASMTGYARATGTVPGASFACEIKSVNGRGLDVRLRLSPGIDPIETDIRQIIGKTLSRGSINCTITVERDGAGGELVLNQQALETVLAAVESLRVRLNAPPPSVEGILGLKGVLEQRDRPLSALAEEALSSAIMDEVARALADLVVARRQEGAQLTLVLLDKLGEIASLVDQAEQHPSRSRATILQKLSEQVANLKQDRSISEERFAQEALLLATKADISEELDRLKAHVASARQLIDNGGAVGRRLDFLAQEFNREANTLCSKSNAVELTTIGLDLKAAIDQLREQVQNIE